MVTSQISEVIEHLRQTVLLRDGAGMTDAQLLECFVSRHDDATFAALVRRHGPMVWGVCRRVLHNHHDAEDAFQATFLVLVRKAASVQPRAMVANWLYGVAHQTALKARATAARRKERERQVAEMPEPAVEDQDLRRDLQPLLDQELSRLPDKYRVAIVLCDLEGKTRKEAARQLGVPEGTLSGRLTRGRTMLAKRIAWKGPVLSGGALAALLSQSVAWADVPTSVVARAMEAASPYAAGQAVVTGLISVRVAALTEGVLKAMLLTKVKVVGAMVAVLMIVGSLGVGAFTHTTLMAGPPDAKDKKAADDKLALEARKAAEKVQATWIPVSAEIAGNEVLQGAARQLVGEALTFANDKVTFKGKEMTLAFTMNSAAKPNEIDLVRGDGTVLPGIYELSGRRLKLCICNDPAQGVRPKAFAGKGTDLLIVLEREVTDQEKIQGVWKENKSGGLFVFSGTKIVIKNNFVYAESETAIKNDEGKTLEGSYALDSERVPRTITITLNEPKVVLRGLCIVDGDHLQIRLAARGQKLPTSWFGEGSEGPLYVFTQDKPKADTPKRD